MFSVRLADAKFFRNIVAAVSTMIDEATFHLSKDGIKIREMDPSRVAMVDLELPKTIFDEYHCSEAVKMCINVTEFLKLIRRVGKDESIELSLDENTRKLQIQISGNYVRTFNMPTLEAIEKEAPTPKVTFNVKAEVTTKGLRQAIEDASLVSDNVRITADNELLTIYATGTLMGATIEFKKDGISLLSIEAKDPSKATYSLSYLSDIVKAASVSSEIAVIEFSTDMPIRLDFKQQKEGKLVFYLAPRIEVE